MRGARNGTNGGVVCGAMRADIARRRLAAAVLGVTLAGGTGAQALPEAAHVQWRGMLESRTLEDGSVLSQYVARTESLDEPDVALAIGFVPRFDCSPLIGIRVVGPKAATLGARLADGDRARLDIDGDTDELALLVDGGEIVTSLWIDGGDDARTTLRQRLDGGSRAALTLPDETPLTFSLLGSRASAAAVEARCRDHVPPPYGD